MTVCRPERVLLCDDDDAFRRRLARSLSDRGIAAFEASNAREALEVFTKNSPDGVLVDLRMPGESGLWLITEIHALNPGVPIVVLTGFGSISTATHAVRLGAHYYLTKPTSVDGIIEAFSPHILKNNAPVPMPSLAQIEAEYVQRVVDEYGGNVTRSAKVLGVHRRSLQRKLKK